MFANANGGVYSSPSLSAYSGQVVNKPTYFAFAKGAGVMGEAGAEGIFPLKRGRDGKLGVAAIGGAQQGGAAPIVYITVESGGNASTQADPGWEEFGKTMGNIAAQESQKVINRNLKPGQPIWKAIKGGQ
jgi:phage-related minor tail protein